MGQTVTQNQRTAPMWRADFGGRESVAARPAKLSKTTFKDRDAVRIALTANAAATTALIAFSALSGPVPANTQLRFGASKYAYTTAAVQGGGVQVAVEPLPAGLVTGDTAYYNPHNRLYIVSGTFIGRTIAERDAGEPYGPWAVGDADGESFLTFYDVLNALTNNDAELYRHGRQVRENLLPDWNTLSNDAKDKIRQLYECEKGLLIS